MPQAVKKQYVSKAGEWVEVPVGGGGGLDQATADGLYVNVAGDTLTGPLVLAADPVAPLETASKQYVDGVAAPIAAAAVPAGAIMMWMGAAAPAGWQLCDGTALSRTEFSDLFDVIGVAYGIGDGVSTFAAPNLKGRVPVGLDAGQTEFSTLAKTGGAKTHTLTTAQMPSHTHAIEFASNTNPQSVGIVAPATSTSQNRYVIANGTADWSAKATGGGDPHNILQPYITVNYIVKL